MKKSDSVSKPLDLRGDLGRAGEWLAAAFLQAHGLRIVTRNLRFRRGEIDLVAMHDETLVIVEVRTRARRDGVPPVCSIDGGKQKRVRRLAEIYLETTARWHRGDVRLDAIGVVLTGDGAEIEWFRDAF